MTPGVSEITPGVLYLFADYQLSYRYNEFACIRMQESIPKMRITSFFQVFFVIPQKEVVRRRGKQQSAIASHLRERHGTMLQAVERKLPPPAKWCKGERLLPDMDWKRIRPRTQNAHCAY